MSDSTLFGLAILFILAVCIAAPVSLVGLWLFGYIPTSHFLLFAVGWLLIVLS